MVPARPQPPFLVGPDWQAELLKDDVLTTVKMFHNACCEALLTLVQENRFETDKVNGIRIIRLKSKEELEIEKMKIKVSKSKLNYSTKALVAGRLTRSEGNIAKMIISFLASPYYTNIHTNVVFFELFLVI